MPRNENSSPSVLSITCGGWSLWISLCCCQVQSSRAHRLSIKFPIMPSKEYEQISRPSFLWNEVFFERAEVPIVVCSRSRNRTSVDFGSQGELTAGYYYDYPIACTAKAAAYCDTNWGPRNTSQPTGSNKLDRMTIDECRLLEGMIIVCMEGAVAWKSYQEKKVSRSSCEPEIHVTYECCKLRQGLCL